MHMHGHAFCQRANAHGHGFCPSWINHMYDKIHDCKEEDIGRSDYNRLRIQHIWKTFGYRISGPVHASLNFFNPLIPVYIKF